MLNRHMLLLVALGLCGPAWGQIYSWIDSNGTVHYADRPPAEGPVRELDPSAATLSTISGTELRGGEQTLLERAEQRARARASVPPSVPPPQPPLVVVQERPSRTVVYRDFVPPRRASIAGAVATFGRPPPWKRPYPPAPDHRPLPWPATWDARLPPEQRPLPWPVYRPQSPAPRVVRPVGVGP